MVALLKGIRKEWQIISLVIAGFIIRVWGLDIQSLWLDELHTMNEADPNIPWSAMFAYLRCCDQHPPLHFIVERIAFSVFGHTAYVGRFVSVVAGTASIWAMWFLGKQVLSRNLGLLAAALTAVNYYNIAYSQEARDYIFAYLFATLSFAYFLKLLKSDGWKTLILYSVFSLASLYSHYYGIFIMVSQVILALIFIFQESGKDAFALFKKFLIAGLIIGIGYLPWIPFVLSMSEIKSFWIGGTSSSFVQDYFSDYMGNSDLVSIFVVSLLVIYISNVSFRKKLNESDFEYDKFTSVFLVLVIWVLATYLIPYIRSVVTVPMLFARYTIVVLPAILLAAAYGLFLLPTPAIRRSVLVFFVIVSLTDLIFVKEYYTKLVKTQYREMTKQLVKSNKGNYPIVNQVSSWQQQYYLKLFGNKAPVIGQSKYEFIDSILKMRNSSSPVPGFWIVGAHGDKPLEDSRIKDLDTVYTLTKSTTHQGAFTQFFLLKKIADSLNHIITYKEFAAEQNIPTDEALNVLLLGGSISTKPFKLNSGKYQMTVKSFGTVADSVYAHVDIRLGSRKLAGYFTTSEFKETVFEFELPVTVTDKLTVTLDNDYANAKEDRNVVLKSIVLEKIQ